MLSPATQVSQRNSVFLYATCQDMLRLYQLIYTLLIFIFFVALEYHVYF